MLIILTVAKATIMKYRYLSIPLLGATFLVSCQSDGGNRRRVQSTTSAQFSVLNTKPVNNPVTQGTTSTAITSIPGERLNPAHGQPGHRCDIAVGAPLPTTTGSIPVFNDPAVTAIQNVNTGTSTLATTTASGLNPAHGKPGHRCDIPVGQPLSSTPAKPQVQTNAVNSTKIDNTPDTLFAKGLNPAHGKPGHRCDIAVGQPLASVNKKDTVTIQSN